MADRVFADAGRKLAVTYLRDGPLVGPDSPFIRFQQRLGFSHAGYVMRPESIPVDLVAEMGFLGRTHIVDCSADDPENYRFVCYGRDVLMENGRNFQGKCVRDASWRAVREFGASEYSRIKDRAAGDFSADFSYVSYVSEDTTFFYRRMVLPLSQSGSDVTHLLVSILLEDVSLAG